MKIKTRHMRHLAGVLLLCFSLLNGSSQGQLAFQHRQMGTLFRILMYAPDSLQAQAAARAAFARIDSLNAIFSDYLPNSELSRLAAKAGKGEWVPVSDELWAVLCRSLELAELSAGAFDPTIGPLSKLWRRAFRQGIFPKAGPLRLARAQVGFSHLQLHPSEKKLRLLASGMRLDLGGIAKGYAVDAAVDVLQAQGIERVLVDGGGDLYAGAPPPGKTGWQVAIGGDTTLLLARQAVATSGDAYRYLEWEGRRYSHIIDPRTGLGISHGLQISVQAPNCTLADALASALSVAPELEELLKKQFPEASAFLSTPMQH